jgi:hypothetical protein
MERNRTRLISIGVVIVVLALGGLVYLNATSPAYACGTEWVAPPTGAPAPGATQQLGYTQGDMGRSHVAVGSVVKYLYCPPASGNHYAQTPFGPIPPKVYGPNEKTLPEGWVHNLEHGGLVLLYKCSGTAAGDGCSDSAQTAMKNLFSSWPASPVCGIQPGVWGPVFTRFDDMQYPYAAVVWDEILPLQTLDPNQILTFFQQEGERVSPEPRFAPRSSPLGAPSSAPGTPTTAPASPVLSAAPAGS